MKEICMLTARHNPLDARITYKEAISLKKAGYKVVIVAPYQDHKHFLPLVKKMETKDLIFDFNGIEIRCFKKKKGFLQLISTAIELIDNGMDINADIYHCHEVDASLFAGIWIKKKISKKNRKIKLIYDSHEHWPASYAERFSNFLLRKAIYFIVNLWERWALRYCDSIFAANEIIKRHLLSLKKDIDIEVLYNCPILTLFQEESKKIKSANNVVICHEGTLSFERGLKNIIETMRKLSNEVDVNIKLLIIGDISTKKEKEWLKKKIAEYKLEQNIECTGWLPYDKLGKKIQGCNIGIIIFQPTPNNKFGVPNKLFNYMRYGLPVVAPTYCLEIRDIINENKCGLLVDATQIEKIHEALKYLLSHPKEVKIMGKRGREAIIKKYHWKEMEKRLLKLYEGL